MDRADARARDWAEIQERMLVPLYEAVYERLDVGHDTRLLVLGCGSGLALLMAAARGATVTGVDHDERRLALARERLLSESQRGPAAGQARRMKQALGPAQGATRGATQAQVLCGGPEQAYERSRQPYTMVTAFESATPRAELASSLTRTTRLTEHGSPVVLAGWGPPERCATVQVLRMAERLAEPVRQPDTAPAWISPQSLSGRDDLEELAQAAGLRLDGSGRVACPFAYPDMDSAVRGLFSTGLFDAAVTASGQTQVEKELMEALHPYRRPDGTVRMENVFRYLIARV